MNPSRRPSGFTLIELILVIAVAGGIAAAVIGFASVQQTEQNGDIMVSETLDTVSRIRRYYQSQESYAGLDDAVALGERLVADAWQPALETRYGVVTVSASDAYGSGLAATLPPTFRLTVPMQGKSECTNFVVPVLTALAGSVWVSAGGSVFIAPPSRGTVDDVANLCKAAVAGASLDLEIR